MFVGFAIDGWTGEGTPVSAYATRDEAMSFAIQRTLSLGVLDGSIGVKECDITAEEADTVNGIVEKLLNKALNTPLTPI